MITVVAKVLLVIIFSIGMIAVPVCVLINITTFFLMRRESTLMHNRPSGPTNHVHRWIWFNNSFLTDTDTLSELGRTYRRWYVGSALIVLLVPLLVFALAYISGWRPN